MDAGSSSKQVYTPHLKKVLKSYQAAATTSLHGPNSVMGMWPDAGSDAARMPASDSAEFTETTGDSSTAAASSSSDALPTPKKAKPSASSSAASSKEYDPFVAPPPFPIQLPPIIAPPDQGSCEISDTILESETISCFTVGGETRLCLPQILNTVLRDFSLQQINCVCDTLHIFCSRCSLSQIEALKSSGVLPVSAPSCGLITKTDAERLCAALLDSHPPNSKMVLGPDVKMPFQVRVYHECFGRCTGLYAPDLYVDPRSRCIECSECQGMLSPQKFVCHAHHPKENRTCHWGFDSFHWRSYILLEIELEENLQLKEVLSEMKSRFDFNHKYKRKQILAESCDPSKRVRVESYYPYPYSLDPTLVYWYANPMWNKVSAFKPMPPVITKDGKPLYIPPEALPSFLKDRYEHHYQTNIALTPANVQKLELMKVPQDQTVIAYHANKSETVSKKHFLKKELDYDSNSCCFDSEDAFSDTSFSTLSEIKKSRNLESIEKSKTSPGTEDGLVSNLDEEDDQPSMESELQQLNKLLNENDIDASLRDKIVGEVETLIAKYRKCLNVAVQGKKLFQMELEKIHHTQRGKLRKLRETNKHLEKEMRNLRTSAAKMDLNSEQTECQNSEVTLIESSSQIEVSEAVDKIDDTMQEVEEEKQPEEGDSDEDETEHENLTRLVTSPTLPKLSPDLKTSPIGI